MSHLLSGNPLKTRADVAAALEALFRPLEPCFSPSGARVDIEPHGSTTDAVAASLEGFARPLWGLAAHAAGGGEADWWEKYRAGLAAGADPEHPDYWGRPGNFDQRVVEASAIAFALCLAPDRLWTPLDDRTRANLIDWLSAARGGKVPRNNWLNFLRLIDLALDRLAGRGDADGRVKIGAEIEAWHLGNGWYRDGQSRQADHYLGFAIHTHALILSVLDPDEPGAPRARERATQFAAGFQHWFDSDGAALPFGRSLTYRFAAGAFWGALAFASVEALPWGEIKGLYLRHLRWWAAQPITRRDGLLTLGYAYPNPQITEHYSAPGSPWWAFKTFLPLALAADHPFWSAEEAAPHHPTEPIALIEPGMIVRHEAGQTIALATGQQHPEIRHGAEKYGKFAYSTRHGFCIEADPRSFQRCAVDNMIGFSIDGADCRVRMGCDAAMMTDALLWSRWHPWQQVAVETWLWWDGPWQVRLHRVRTPIALQTLEGGFAVAAGGGLRIDGGTAAIFAPDGASIIADPARQARVLKAAPNSSLMYPRALVPQLGGRIEPGETVLTTAVLATTDIALAEQSWRTPPAAPPVTELEAAIAADGRPIPVHALDRSAGAGLSGQGG